MFETVLPYFVLVNILGVAISWPLAKYAMIIFKVPYHWIAIFITLIIVLANIYVGYTSFRELSYIVQFIFFSVMGIALRNYNLLPAVAAFLLSNDIESVLIREYLFIQLHFRQLFADIEMENY